MKSKIVHKYWRDDKNVWETKYKIFFIRYYIYSIFINGKIKTKFRFFKYKNPKYIKSAISTKIYIGKKEFKDVYNSNKYTVPLNYVLDLTK